MDTRSINNPLLLGEVATNWLKYYKNSFKPGTIQTYKCLLDKYILKEFSDKCEISSIDSMQLVDFSESLLNKKFSSKTVNDTLLVLNAIIKYANEFCGVKKLLFLF